MNASDPLSHSIRTGVLWTASTRGVLQALDVVTSIVLARLLLPEQFGVIAVTAGFLGLSFVVGNFGMGGAVVQAERLDRVDCDTAFAIATVTGLALWLAMAAASPITAVFFGMPVLRTAMPVIAVQVAFGGAAATALALLRRRLQFGVLAFIEAVAVVTNAVTSIGLAWWGWGVWSLVWGPVLASGLTLLLAHAYAGYLPRPVFDRRAARRLAGFGGTLAAKNVFVHLSRYADHLAVGRLLGAGALGLYSRARNYSSTPDTRLLPMLHSVFFPAFARVRTDHDRFIEWFSKAMTLAAVVSAPLLLGGLALAHDFTVALLGPQWVGMVPALQVLCVAGLIDAVHRLGTAAIEAAGKLRYEVVPQVVYAVLIFGGSVAGARLGIEGVAWAMLVAAAAFYLMQGFAIRAAVGVPWRVYAGAGLPAVAAAAIMAGVVRLAAGLAGAEWSDGGAHESLTRLAAGITAGVVSYPLLLALVAPSQARMLLDQIAHLRAGHARRTQALRDGHGVVRAGEL